MSSHRAPHEACEATWDLLPAAALDALSDAEMQLVTAHADRCEPCRGELASMRRVASQLTYATPLEPIPPARLAAVRARLHARALGDDPGQPEATVALGTLPAGKTAGEPRRYGMRTWIMGAALAASMVALAGVAQDRRELSRRIELERREQTATIASLRTDLATRDTLLWALTDPEIRVIALTTPAPRAAGALMFWNRPRNRWTFIAHDLPPLEAGRIYQLWLVVDSRPTSVGLVSPDANGNARIDAELVVASDARPHVAITNEPAGGSPQPTGEPVIAGAAPR